LAAGSTLSRRLSEFLGVSLFAAALIWLIALVTYEPADPVWFWKAGADGATANFIGPVGAFIAESSFQLVGYAAFLAAAALGVVAWTLFWCRAIDAVYTKIVGGVLLLCSLTALLTLALGRAASDWVAGGMLGVQLAGGLARYFNQTGSIILILTVLLLSVILSTQFSFGRLSSSAVHAVSTRWQAVAARIRERRETRRREKQRQEIVRKHTARNPEEVKAAQAKAAERPAAPARPPADETRPAAPPPRPVPQDPPPGAGDRPALAWREEG
jgi:S-DNA-T family DNA segregation ATPase FtsK/SpoIIIE